ncbi:MAG: exosortase/archaeosortase family protein, partial [Planctomycetota bacterium]
MVSPVVDQDTEARIDKAAWLKILILAGLFVWLTGWHYKSIVLHWLQDTNWTHGFIIPLFSIYLIYQRRDEIFTAPRNTNFLGMPVMIVGILVLFLLYAWIPFPYLSRLAMPVILLGLVWFLCGTRLMILLWLPIFYIVFAIPMPDMLYQYISVPLQQLAAKASAAILALAGVQIEVSFSNLTIVGQSGEVYSLTVAEACSGVRSLMAFAALGVALAYITDKPLWHRVVMVLSILPVAIFCNVIRVTITSSMYAIDEPELGQDFMHTFLGMLMLIPAAILFLLISWTLGAIFVTEENPEDGPGKDKAPVKS